MKWLKGTIKYLVGVLVQPICLILLWVYEFKPYDYIESITGWTIHSSNEATVKGALNLATIVLIYNVGSKLIENIASRFKKPIEIKMEVLDPKDNEKDSVIKIDPNEGKVIKLKFKYFIRYKFLFLKKIYSPDVELNWSTFIQIELDERESARCSVREGSKKFSFSPCDLIGEEEDGITLNLALMFSIENTFIQKGSVSPRIRYKRGKIFFVLLEKIFVNQEKEGLQVVLKKE